MLLSKFGTYTVEDQYEKQKDKRNLDCSDEFSWVLLSSLEFFWVLLSSLEFYVFRRVPFTSMNLNNFKAKSFWKLNTRFSQHNEIMHVFGLKNISIYNFDSNVPWFLGISVKVGHQWIQCSKCYCIQGLRCSFLCYFWIPNLIVQMCSIHVWVVFGKRAFIINSDVSRSKKCKKHRPMNCTMHMGS